MGAKKWVRVLSILVVCMAPFIGAPADAGVTVQDLGVTLNPEDLVFALIGNGVTVSNVSFKGENHAAGTFSDEAGTIGFKEGIILSSGKIAHVIGPNNSPAMGWANNLPGDPDAATLIPGYQTYDATVLEFDFIPVGNKIVFEYVFGSEEYLEWVGTPFNDVFGFFINGVNLALIPYSEIPVAINSVNHLSNTEHFRDNTAGGIDTQMDGLTTVLTVTADVKPNETNHIKLVVADAGDFIYDSWVMIRAGSFSSIPDLYLESLPTAKEIGTKHQLRASATLDGAPRAGVTVSFTVVDGPNVNDKGFGVTDYTGTATWGYIGDGGQGTDTIQAAAMINGMEKTSNEAFKVWEAPPNHPPVANAGPEQVIEANTADGALVTLDGSLSTDDGNTLPLDYTWSWMEGGEIKTAAGVSATVKLPLGVIPITLTVYDGEFSASDSMLITVVDTTPPDLIITCAQGVNPHGENTPGESNGKAKGLGLSKALSKIKGNEKKPEKKDKKNDTAGKPDNQGDKKDKQKPDKGKGPKKDPGKKDKNYKNQNPDGFYEITVATSDNSDADVAVYIGTADDPLMFAVEPGTMVVKFTEAPGAQPEMKKMGAVNGTGRAAAVEYHITLPGDPVISAVDMSGNIVSSQTCYVPPYPM